MAKDMELDDVQDEVEDVTSTGEDSSTNQNGKVRQPTNWQDDPEYRRQQSKRDRELAQARNAAAQAAAEARQLREWVEQNSMRGLEGEELALARNRQLEQKLAEVMRQRDLDAFAIQRQRDLQDIVNATGIPIEEIEDANNVHEAWQKGFAYRDKETGTRTSKAQRQQEMDDAVDDRVDVGQGKAKNAAAALQAKYDKAREDYDMGRTIAIMDEASRKGVAIREW